MKPVTAASLRIRPGSAAFSVLLGLLVALPTFGIDLILPSLPATAAALRAPVSEIGFTMSVYMLSLGSALLVYGPLSDRFGRRPVVVFGCALLIIGSLGCILAQSLSQLLLCRVVQGIGASGPGMAAAAIVTDLFEGEAAREKMSFVVSVTNIVPMLAPLAGAALLELGGWRLLYGPPIAAALLTLLAILHLDETAPQAHRADPGLAAVLGGYRRVLANPVCLGNALCNAALAAAVFANVTGSALVFIKAFEISPHVYGLVCGAGSLSVMVGAFLNGRLAGWGLSSSRAMACGIALAGTVAALLMTATLAGLHSPVPVTAAIVGGALALGLVAPNAIHHATRQMPGAAGSVTAVAVFLQMTAAAVAGGLVARFFDGHTALSMASVMLVACVLAAGAYAGIARPADKRGEPA